MAPVGIRYRSNTYQNIGCKFNKGCIIFLICKNNRLELQYPCIRRYQSYQRTFKSPNSFFCFNSSVCIRIFLLYLLLLRSIVIFYFSVHSCGVVAFSLALLRLIPLYIVCTVQLNELTIYGSLYGSHEDSSSLCFISFLYFVGLR